MNRLYIAEKCHLVVFDGRSQRLLCSDKALLPNSKVISGSDNKVNCTDCCLLMAKTNSEKVA